MRKVDVPEKKKVIRNNHFFHYSSVYLPKDGVTSKSSKMKLENFFKIVNLKSRSILYKIDSRKLGWFQSECAPQKVRFKILGGDKG